MTKRPDRTTQNSFQLHDRPVTFEFLDSTHVKITVPANSGWWFPIHWHTRSPGSCKQITSLRGSLQVNLARPYAISDSSFRLSPGSPFHFTLGDHNDFGPIRKDEELVVVLEAEPSQTILLRNICGVALDAQLYPFLASTPYWIRIPYAVLSYSPWAQQYLTAKLLWVQTQMMQSAHNFYAYHGRINAPYAWSLAHPWHWEMAPQWTYNIMWWSCTPISKLVQNTCYWVGRLLLGMQAEYAEYMPAAGSGGAGSGGERINMTEKAE